MQQRGINTMPAIVALVGIGALFILSKVLTPLPAAPQMPSGPTPWPNEVVRTEAETRRQMAETIQKQHEDMGDHQPKSAVMPNAKSVTPSHLKQSKMGSQGERARGEKSNGMIKAASHS